MSGQIELNREEISRLSKMDDLDGHAWALYLLFKKHMDIYSGIVQVDRSILARVLENKLSIDDLFKDWDFSNYVNMLITQLLKVEIITDYVLKNNLLSIKLPIAYGDVCVEDTSQH